MWEVDGQSEEDSAEWQVAGVLQEVGVLLLALLGALRAGQDRRGADGLGELGKER